MGWEQTPGRGLNHAQRTALTVTVRHLELTLDRIEALLAGAHAGRLHRTVTDLAPELAAPTPLLIAALRREIATMANEFSLTAAERDGRREIAGLLAIAWESLEDSRAAKLGRYGDIDPTLPDTLDPHIERLITLVVALARQVTRPPER